MSSSMDDVARRAGLSKSTVSLALNGKAGVSIETQGRVLRAAAELNYRLPGQRVPVYDSKNKTITLVHCYLDREREYSGPEPTGLYLKYLQGVQQFVREQENINLNVIVGYKEGDTSHLAFHLLEGDEYNTNGLILMGGGVRQSSHLVQRIIERQLPAVALSRNWSHIPISTVSQDHYQQTQLALDHLISLGHRNIAFVARESDQNYDWYEPRLRCYRETMNRCNGEVNPDRIALYADASQSVKLLLARSPEITAIFAINDRRAIDVMSNLRELQLHVPKDISLIGLDDSVATPDGWTQITRVAFPEFKVGYLAADLLLRQINQIELYYSNVLVRSYLLEGGSCAIPRQDNL